MFLKDLEKVAAVGAAVKHRGYSGYAYRDCYGAWYWKNGDPVTACTDTLDDRWEIAEPAPVPGLAPGCEAWTWNQDEKLWQSPATLPLPGAIRWLKQAELAEPGSGWTGRYGYIREREVLGERQVLWRQFPRIEDGEGVSDPDYVEMRAAQDGKA